MARSGVMVRCGGGAGIDVMRREVAGSWGSTRCIVVLKTECWVMRLEKVKSPHPPCQVNRF
jgi:hypothetical protein